MLFRASDSEYRIDRSDISDKYNDSDDTVDINTDYDNIFDDKEYHVRLADLGTCIKYKKKMTKFDIQTRYYKSPEILLHLNYNQNCDIWALGCTTYELLTGKILFDPEGNSMTNKVRHHLYDIETKIGPIPVHMKYSSPMNDIYYQSDGKIKGIAKYISNPLLKSLEYLRETEKDENLLLNIIDFIYTCLKIDPTERPNVEKCLQHPVFNMV